MRLLQMENVRGVAVGSAVTTALSAPISAFTAMLFKVSLRRSAGASTNIPAKQQSIESGDLGVGHRD